MGTYYDGSTYREFRAFSSYIKAAIKDNELGDRQPILHPMTHGVVMYIVALVCFQEGHGVNQGVGDAVEDAETGSAAIAGFPLSGGF